MKTINTMNLDIDFQKKTIAGVWWIFSDCQCSKHHINASDVLISTPEYVSGIYYINDQEHQFDVVGTLIIQQ